jgi:hypothetical protein
MPGEPTVIYSAANVQQAHLLKGLLEERGIAAWVVNDSLQVAAGELPLGWTAAPRAAPRVVVAASDAEEARQFALSFDEQTAHEPEPDAAGKAPPAVEWADWPICPACRQRREARCPACGISGMAFPLADIQRSAAGERVLLFCSTCDDHFVPEWYRLCSRCGHDFGEGIEFGGPAPREPLNPRTWLVLAGLAVAGGAIVAYFVWLFRNQG